MAGEVKSQLTIRLEGGTYSGSGGGSSTTAPVSRRADLLNPGQSASNFTAERQLKWSRVMAMEAARDQTAMREIHAGLEKLEVQRHLETASSVRREVERRRENLRNLVATNQLMGQQQQALTRQMLPRALRRGPAGMISRMGGFGSMARGGLGGMIAHELLPAGGGLAGAGLRVVGESLAAAAQGGGPAGWLQAVWSTIRELRDLQTADARAAEVMRAEQVKIRQEAKKLVDDVKARFDEVDKEIREEFDRFTRHTAATALSSAYRQDRYISYNLVP